MSDLISREDAINAIYHAFPNISMERATEILHECEMAEIIRCKDCRKHNVEHGYYPGGHVVRKEDSCPLVAYRGKAQGHEYDYQYCVFGERREE